MENEGITVSSLVDRHMKAWTEIPGRFAAAFLMRGVLMTMHTDACEFCTRTRGALRRAGIEVDKIGRTEPSAPSQAEPLADAANSDPDRLW